MSIGHSKGRTFCTFTPGLLGDQEDTGPTDGRTGSAEAFLVRKESICSWRISILVELAEDMITGVNEERGGASS